LKIFPKLTHLRLAGNQIEILEKNLFNKTEKISSISIDEKNIFHVDPKTFFWLKVENLIFFEVNFEKCDYERLHGPSTDIKVMNETLNEIFDGEICYNSNVGDILYVLDKYREGLNECKNEKGFSPLAWVLTVFFVLLIVSFAYEVSKYVKAEKVRKVANVDPMGNF
jgi:hypothetical protein